MKEFDSKICHLCGSLSFPSWRDKISHYLKSHSPQLPFICPIDNEFLTDPFDSHFIHDHGFKEWTSEFSFFKLIGETDTSLKADHEQCSKCGLICTNEMASLYHSTFHHQMKPEPLTNCLFCPNISSNLKDLITHVLKSHCGMTFSLNSDKCDTFDLEQCLDTPDTFLCNISKIKNEDNVFHGNDGLNQTKLDEILREHLETLTQIPNQINDDSEGDAWDINKLNRILDDPRNEENIKVVGERKCFSCKLEFETHMKKICHRSQMHSSIEGPTYQCNFCSKSFSNESKATLHMFEEHGYSTLHPWYLSQGLITNSDYKISLGSGRYQCCICGLNCSSDTNFLIHKISSHSSNTPEYDCNYCFDKYPSKSSLRLHVLIGHGSYKYHCPVCSLTFDESIEFCEHVESEHIINKFDLPIESSSSAKKKVVTCDLCLLNVEGPRMLSKHMLSIHGITLDFDCNKCGKLFESQQTLDAHMTSIHAGNLHLKDFICEKCSRMFSSNHLLQTHMRSHYKGNKITCETCGKTFKWQSSLVRHTRFVHSSPTLSVKYGCKFCGKSFKDQSSLKDHVFTHTGDKPFKCDDCGKGFVRKSLLMNHLAKCLM
ncbi:uncharacterized protein [Lepeophtheirus salmonis]|nr:zinc finger protein 268-like isoform X2 [Lepeophtheirus salmonis]XP_040576320.1 zinc finger protein 268-like isoform X2 [Lepeophtheirus salmonis]